MRYIAPLLALLIFCATVTAANINITYNINTDVNRTPISKYIYGINLKTGKADYTVVQNGGNLLTAYNWENNWSSSGCLWWWLNNQGLSSSTIPGKYVTDLYQSCINNKQDCIVTLQMAGYVSAAVGGFVDCNLYAAPSYYFKKVVFAKNAPFCSPPGSPDITDANVYMDEFVNFLVSKYGHAGDPNGVKFYCTDNEPDLWYGTNPSHGAHWEVHPYMTNCAEIKDKTVAVSLAVKNVDPNAQILGPDSYGFGGYLTFQDACDWKPPLSDGYSWFLDYYLDKMEANSVAAGKRLLDALDVHWYPQAYDGKYYPNGTYDGNCITDTPSVYSNANCNARMQAPRTLWDTSYVYPDGEVSWINRWCSSYLPILPKLKNSINTYYPDTNLAITEYSYGGEAHWSGGIAEADVLGIYGKYGVYLATGWYWQEGNYVDAAIKLYTNYDSNKSSFGDTEVYAAETNIVDSSIYASVFKSHPCELHMIVINKNINNAITGTFNIDSPQKFTSGRVWHFDNTSSNITETTAISSITNNSFTYTIPATTVCHMVLQTGPHDWDYTGDCDVNLIDLAGFADDWLNPYDFLDFASFAQEWVI